MYYEGNGVPQDYLEAFKLMHKAAESGHARAQAKLGDFYMNGKGCTRSPDEAVYWYRKAAEQHITSSMTNLAQCLENGIGCERNIEEAVIWYEKAASNGDHEASERLVILVGNLSFIQGLCIGHASPAA
jgi:TPR repeat protein